DVGRVLVIAGVGDGDADLVQVRRPAQHRSVSLRGLVAQVFVYALCESRDALGLRRIHLIAPHELTYGRFAHVAVSYPPDQVVEHALAKSAIGNLQVVDAEFSEGRRHDRDAAGNDGGAVCAQAGQIQLVDCARLDKQSAELLEPGGG